ncbi:MAG: ATP-binding cassette domain-containing protein [Alphaproteobacteria bacterium]|jgi:putative ABC transport system ATP-binding protein|nr:ATP-binding cassette domain-containing protein [Alphaproteobacteria bacterium]
MAGNAVIAVEALRHEIGGRLVLELPEWRVAAGEHCLVLGASGSGKTTLLNIVSGLLRPSAGKVFLAGQPLSEMGAAARDAIRGRHVGIVFQTLHLIGALAVADNLRLARRLAGLTPDETLIGELLAALDLAPLARARPRRLSFGEAQRVAIARAVVTEPALVLADEPTSALDDANCERVAALLLAQSERLGASLVVATHDARLTDRFESRLKLPGGAAP